MNRWCWSTVGLVCVLAGCSTPKVSLSPFDVAGPPPQASAPPPVAPKPPPLFLLESGPKDAQAAVNWAASQALIRPRREYFRQGTLVYPWQDGRTYLIKTKKGQHTDVFFPEGEKLIPGIGLDDFWELKEVDGFEPGTRAHLVIKPLDIGLKQTMVVLTTGGSYYLQVESDDRPGVSSVTWEKPMREDPVHAAPVVHESFGGGYVLDIPTPPPLWLPVRVYHNRYQTLIQCAPLMTVTEAPVVYALDREGKRQLVNWTLRDDTIIIDRRGVAFELQGSSGPSDLVRIRYVGESQTTTAEGRP